MSLKFPAVSLSPVQLLCLDIISRDISNRLVGQKPFHLTVSVSIQDQLLHPGCVQTVKSSLFTPERHDSPKSRKNAEQRLLHISLCRLLFLCQEFGLLPLKCIIHRNNALGSLQLIKKIRLHIHRGSLNSGKMPTRPV